MDSIKKQILQKDNIINIVNIIKNEIKRDMNKSEIEGLVSYLKENDYTRYNNYNNKNISLDQKIISVSNLISKDYSQKIKRTLVNDNIDVKALLTQEIQRIGDEVDPFSNFDKNFVNKTANISSVNNSNNLNNVINSISTVSIDPDRWHLLQRDLGRENIKREANFYFDSRYRDVSDMNTDRYVFSFNNTYARRPGTINNIGNIRDIIEITCDQIILPFNNTTSNYYGQITMQISQFKNAYISAEGPEFHFIFNTTILPNNTVRLTPVNNTCKLRDPMTVIETLTLIFKSPLTPVKFDSDRLNCSILYLNPATFTATSPHFLETGDIVYLSDFTTLDPIGDNNIIQQTNSVEGHIINKINSTQFSIPLLDFSVITAPNLTLTPLVYFGSKRGFIPLKFGYILPQKGMTD